MWSLKRIFRKPLRGLSESSSIQVADDLKMITLVSAMFIQAFILRLAEKNNRDAAGPEAPEM